MAERCALLVQHVLEESVNLRTVCLALTKPKQVLTGDKPFKIMRRPACYVQSLTSHFIEILVLVLLIMIYICNVGSFTYAGEFDHPLTHNHHASTHTEHKPYKHIHHASTHRKGCM